VWQQKEKNGIKKMGIVRSTFVVNKAGELVIVQYQVAPQGHAQDMLDVVKAL
jgi:peroxiredoxin